MELVDENGRPIGGKSKEQVKDILKTVRPKNREQEAILAKAMVEKLEQERLYQIRQKIKSGFGGTFKDNYIARSEGDGYTKDRSLRLKAVIPPEMLFVAQQVWGPNVLRDENLFREAFVKDETGRLCLTVDPKTI